MLMTQDHPSKDQFEAEPKITRPMLQIIQGPSTGRIYPLDRRINLIGRWTGCDVVLNPLNVSNRHAIVERSSGGYFLSDVGSRAGTFVAGRPISGPIRLVDGALFRICEFIFLFTDGVLPIEGPEDTTTVAATIDVSNPAPDRPTVPSEQKLQVLLEIGRDLGRAMQADEVLDRALESLFRIFPQAARGAVFLRAESDGSPIPRVIRSRSGHLTSPPTCQAILNRVMGDREAILSRDSLREFPGSKSIALHSIRSLISAPLLDSAGHSLGAIQLDANEGDGQFDAEDLDVLVAVAGPVGIAVENAQWQKASIRESERDHELHLARRVLMNLLPKKAAAPPGYETFSFYEPASQVGGDYLGTFPLTSPGDRSKSQSRRWALAVGDVAGHGLPAALLLVRLSTEVRMILKGDVEPARCLDRLNQQILSVGEDDFFVTFSLATLDVETHRFESAGAGHLAPLIRRARGGPIERLGQDVTGLPLALDETSRYQSTTTVIEPGDVVVLCTDGIYEAMDANARCLTINELERVIQAAPPTASAVGKAILEAVRSHTGDTPQTDDMTIYCLNRLA